MKKKLLTSLMALGFVFALSSASFASAATVQAPPFCNGKPPTNTPCVPVDW
ncbi:hypothetical protein H7992_07055 [Sporosarcina sp. resist]|uniref:hypothetical protein n=1 Tax=Sporosarcina sp. resist TaxID=2762563 RepID=UPI00164E5296|nr:hypothetical protein [Sporosarcina sp. resist]QNK89417.1 hypothetical protein H7992_07055 [Sporosarcina sp. resist]